jgi:MFS family permease
VFARDVLHGDSQLLGFLTGAVGAGALTGAFFLASRETVNKMPDIIRISALLFAVGLAVFSFSNSHWLSLTVLYFAGFGMIVQFVATNAILQTVVADDKKGRVLSFYSMSFMGFTPVGSLLLGSIAKWLGVPLTFSFAAFVLLIAAIFYSLKLSSIKEILSLEHQEHSR